MILGMPALVLLCCFPSELWLVALSLQQLPTSHCCSCATIWVVPLAEPCPERPLEVASLSLHPVQNLGTAPGQPAPSTQHSAWGWRVPTALPQTSRKQLVTVSRQASPGRQIPVQMADSRERVDENA